MQSVEKETGVLTPEMVQEFTREGVFIRGYAWPLSTSEENRHGVGVMISVRTQWPESQDPRFQIGELLYNYPQRSARGNLFGVSLLPCGVDDNANLSYRRPEDPEAGPMAHDSLMEVFRRPEPVVFCYGNIHLDEHNPLFLPHLGRISMWLTFVTRPDLLQDIRPFMNKEAAFSSAFATVMRNRFDTFMLELI